MVCQDDFGPIGKASKNSPDMGAKRKAEDQGEQRQYLKVFETLGPQLLNAYGEAKFTKVEDKDVWEAFSNKKANPTRCRHHENLHSRVAGSNYTTAAVSSVKQVEIGGSLPPPTERMSSWSNGL